MPDDSRHAEPADATGEGLDFEFTNADFARVCRLIHEQAGISLGPSKRHMVYSRLGRRLRQRRLKRFSDYLDLVEKGGAEERTAFVNSLTTNLTSFFREAHHFPTLATLLREHAAQAPLTIWCTAASTGEEPYSLAITACEAFSSLAPPVKILATDIDTEVLATGAAGVYPLERLDPLTPEKRRAWFLRGRGAQEGFARVRPELQALIEFRRVNLLEPNWNVPSGLTAIFCRNVMIYFDHPTQAAILKRFAPLLAPGGRLFAGHSESFAHSANVFRLLGRTVYAPVGT
ncbi:MAG: CheR family methyltransferase [Burkholderiales bacterium]